MTCTAVTGAATTESAGPIPGSTRRRTCSVDIVVTVETFVFSLPQNKLVWTGTSESTNPKNAEKLVQQLAQDSVRELHTPGPARAIADIHRNLS